MKKLLKGTLVVAVTAAVAVGAALAYFSDTEVSTGNSFVAGLVDLKVSSNGYFVGPTGDAGEMIWDAKDLVPGEDMFFNFTDLKPGDWGENTIDLLVESNPVWACATLTLTSNAENLRINPEIVAGDTSDDVGELAESLHVIWWADDGDNVLEDNELESQYGHIEGKLSEVLAMWGPANQLPLTLADSTMNFYGNPVGTPLSPTTPYYVGVGWCFGDMIIDPVVQDGVAGTSDPMVNPGFTCDGSSELLNMAQTDSLTADIEFYVEQYRNNADFVCPERAIPTD